MPVILGGTTGNVGAVSGNNVVDSGVALSSLVTSIPEGGVGSVVTNQIVVTQAEYDGLTPNPTTYYIIVG